MIKLFRKSPRRCGAALALFALLTPAAAQPPDAAGFAKYVADLWSVAQAKGITRPTFDAATKGLHYDPKIAAHTERQAEFSLSIPAYLAGAVIKGLNIADYLLIPHIEGSTELAVFASSMAGHSSYRQ